MTTPRGRADQRGAVLLLMAVALSLSALATLMLYLNGGTLTWQQRNQDQRAMAEAKEALIAWAVVNGALPCPDLDGNGEEDTIAGECKNVDVNGGNTIRVGRVPWKSLGLTLSNQAVETLVDSTGNAMDPPADKLWYAQVSTTSGVIFSPGNPIVEENQKRSTQTEQQGYGNYLENILVNGAGVVTFPNSGIVSPEVECIDSTYTKYTENNSDTRCNDRWLDVSLDSYIGDKILKDIKQCLFNYEKDAANMGYPDPIDISGATNFGRISDIVFSGSGIDSCVNFESKWSVNWRKYLFLQVAQGWVQGEGQDCVTGGNCLLVNSAGSNQAVVVFAGGALSTQTRDSSMTVAAVGDLVDYLEDANANSYATRNFKSDVFSSIFNDQLACLDGASDDSDSQLCP